MKITEHQETWQQWKMEEETDPEILFKPPEWLSKE